MVSCSSSASRSPSRRSLGTCAATRGHRLRAGGRFSAITSTASRRSTSLSCRRSHSKFCIVVRHGRRLWVSFGVTANPTAEWISRQVTEAFPWDHAPRYLVRDRDTSYGPVFLQQIRAMGIRDHPIAPRSPWQNAYVERLIGSIRRECLDHMIVFGEAHLRRILRGYATYYYYNVSRTHRSLNKDAPLHRAIERLGAVVSRPVLGGLHHQYCRI
jgi:transposase InsO family protein